MKKILKIPNNPKALITLLLPAGFEIADAKSTINPAVKTNTALPFYYK